MGRRIVRRALSASLVTLGMSTGVQVAEAMVVGAPPCFAHKGTTEYQFEGSAEALPAGEDAFKVTQYEALFSASDPVDPDNVPLEGKNNVRVDVVNDADRTTIKSVTSPDELRYGLPHRQAIDTPRIVQGTEVFVRFTAEFDRRDDNDPVCETRTPLFTMVGRQADIQPVCDKTSICRVIDP